MKSATRRTCPLYRISVGFGKLQVLEDISPSLLPAQLEAWWKKSALPLQEVLGLEET